MIAPTPATRGMALILVLWMVAALSLIAVGLLASVRSEIGTATQTKQSIIAGAIADGAIRRILTDLAVQRKPISHPIKLSQPWPGQPVSAEVSPLNGLIDINNASEALLSALLQYHAGLDASASNKMALAMVEARSRRDNSGQLEGFDALEDLLRIPDFNHDLYARIKPLISTNLRGGGRVNPQAAPSEVLAVLLQGNASLASQIVATRNGADSSMDVTRFNPAFVETAATPVIAISARVALANGATLVRSWAVMLAPSLQTGLPWQLLEVRQHTEPKPAVTD